MPPRRSRSPGRTRTATRDVRDRQPAHARPLYDGPTVSGSPLTAGSPVTDVSGRVTYVSTAGVLGRRLVHLHRQRRHAVGPATVSINVTNAAPAFNQNLPNRTDAEGAAISLSSPATDVDNDTLTYAATGLPTGLSIDHVDRPHLRHDREHRATGQPLLDQSITVSDDGGTTVGRTDTFTWTVDNTNRLPTFNQDLTGTAPTARASDHAARSGHRSRRRHPDLRGHRPAPGLSINPATGRSPARSLQRGRRQPVLRERHGERRRRNHHRATPTRSPGPSPNTNRPPDARTRTSHRYRRRGRLVTRSRPRAPTPTATPCTSPRPGLPPGLTINPIHRHDLRDGRARRRRRQSLLAHLHGQRRRWHHVRRHRHVHAGHLRDHNLAPTSTRTCRTARPRRPQGLPLCVRHRPRRRPADLRRHGPARRPVDQLLHRADLRHDRRQRGRDSPFTVQLP